MDQFMDQADALKFLQYLYEERKLGERTVNLYKFYYSHFNPSMLSQDYVSYFIIGHKNTTAVRGMILNYLNMKGITDIKLPARSIDGDKIKRVIRNVSLKEVYKISSFLHSQSFKKGLIFDLVYQGALRRVEVATITLGSFRWEEWIDDLDKMCKLIVLGKGKKERVVLINPETVQEILKRILPHGIKSIDQITRMANSNRLLFARSDGSPISEKQVYDTIKKGSIKAIGRDVRPHELRHARSTEFQKRGLTINDIKNYLGHSRIATTEIYLHKSGEESLETIEDNLKLG